MDSSVSNPQVPRGHNFDRIKDCVLQSSQLPLVEVLDCNECEEFLLLIAKGATHQPQQVPPTNHTPKRFRPAGPRQGAIHPLKSDAERCHPLNLRRAEKCHPQCRKVPPTDCTPVSANGATYKSHARKVPPIH